MFTRHISIIKNVAGDTLVEVLMAFTILGFFTIVSTKTAIDSLRSSQVTQERSEAISILQSQIEFLHAGSQDATYKTIVEGTGLKVFCINPGTGSPVALTGTHSTHVPDSASDNLGSPSPYPSACVHSSKYHVSIVSPTPSDSSFVFRARWAGLSNPDDEVVFRYTVYNGNVAVSPSPSPSPSPPPGPGPGCPIPSPVTYAWMNNPINVADQSNRITGPVGVGPMQLTVPFSGIPAWSNYTVTLRSYDTHDYLPGDLDPTKVNERFRAIIRNGSGTAIYTSPYSNDIPDTAAPPGQNYRQGPPDVFTGQTIGAGAQTLVVQHINAGSDGFHVQSVTVSCP